MTLSTAAVRDVTPRSVAPPAMLSPALVLGTPGVLRRAVVAIGDLLGLAVIISCIPIVILAIGTPIALFVRLLLWVAGVLWP
jgi:hypothetical protein